MFVLKLHRLWRYTTSWNIVFINIGGKQVRTLLDTLSLELTFSRIIGGGNGHILSEKMFVYSFKCYYGLSVGEQSTMFQAIISGGEITVQLVTMVYETWLRHSQV